MRRGALALSSLARFSRSDPAPGQLVVADGKTKLMWQGCAAGQSGTLVACTGGATPYTWQAAMTYCEGLTWGGFSDWRLPDFHELQSIIDWGRYNPAIDGTAFPGTPADYFWSSSPSTYVGNASYAWAASFGSGYVDWQGKYSTFPARCVRPGP